MNNIEFVEKLKKLVNTPSHYAKGCFLQKATNNFINQKAKQYPSWYTTSKIEELKALDDVTLLSDCCGMVKGILWGYPNTIYTSNGVPDQDETTMFNKCNNKSSDFNKIEIGELCWMPGHVGVYAGDGLVIECTNAWEHEILYSSFIKGKSNHYRVWNKHGKLPYIDYIEEDKKLFRVQVDTDWLEVHKSYDTIKVYRDRPALDILETKDNFGRTSDGWIDLTKCKRVKEY